MKKNKIDDLYVPGWFFADVVANFFTQCDVCKKKPKVIYFKRDGKSMKYACKEHALTHE